MLPKHVFNIIFIWNNHEHGEFFIFYYLFGKILLSFALDMNAFDNRYLAEKLEIKL